MTLKLLKQWQQRADYFMYTETTADGYEVWVTTDNDRRQR